MLYDHQKLIVTEDKKKCGLFLGTGSGKTITALSMAQGEILVIAPKTVRDDMVWQKNLEKTKLERNLTVISKEDFRLGKFERKTYNTIIIDEADQVAGVTPSIRWVKKQPLPKASKVFDKLIEYLYNYPPQRLYLLTATPVRSPMCVYGLARLLGVSWNFYEFRDTFYIARKMGYREIFIPKSDTASKERLGKAVQSLGYTGKLDDYFDVPDQVYVTRHIELTKEQKQRLKEIAVEYPDPLVLIGKKHQIENGVLTGNEFSEGEDVKDNKIEAIKDLALEFPKMVIFAKYTMQVEKIQKALKGYKVLTLQGSTKNRQEVIQTANESKECIIIIQSQISAGYELPNIPTMVFASMSYSVVDRIQAEGRILRANALKKNLYIDLVSKGEIDRAVHKSILNKVDFSEKIYAKKRS